MDVWSEIPPPQAASFEKFLWRFMRKRCVLARILHFLVAAIARVHARDRAEDDHAVL
jgi:hypothetical protein